MIIRSSQFVQPQCDMYSLMGGYPSQKTLFGFPKTDQVWRFQQKSLSHLAWPTSWLYLEISHGEPQISAGDVPGFFDLDPAIWLPHLGDAGRCWAMLGDAGRCWAPTPGISPRAKRLLSEMAGDSPPKLEDLPHDDRFHPQQKVFTEFFFHAWHLWLVIPKIVGV